jgi:predicted component of type VI protein secretion system
VRKDTELVESSGRLQSKQEQWEALATQQQEALGKFKKERDDALEQSRGLSEEVRA